MDTYRCNIINYVEFGIQFSTLTISQLIILGPMQCVYMTFFLLLLVNLKPEFNVTNPKQLKFEWQMITVFLPKITNLLVIIPRLTNVVIETIFVKLGELSFYHKHL